MTDELARDVAALRRWITEETGRRSVGAVVRLGPQDWRHHGAYAGHLVLRVHRVRDDLAQYYDGWIWLEGERLDGAGAPVARCEALVRVGALPGYTPGP